jgi:hypothetical protein
VLPKAAAAIAAASITRFMLKTETRIAYSPGEALRV